MTTSSVDVDEEFDIGKKYSCAYVKYGFIR
jgi:hypothetical protein